MSVKGDNFNRVYNVLTKGSLKGIYSPPQFPVDVAKHFKEWFVGEEVK